ncbi:MAG: DUF3037 domain-containing protein [Lachnospiraceae bacterium]|nr:DUF3037 domain-containing protein [Lachnospiraceae bacterium]
MDKILKYSVLRYSPSAIAGEKINLGIMFYDEASGYREFKYSKKYSRLTAFDDEIDIQMVKHMLKSISDDVNGNIFTYNTFDINAYTKYFINDFFFEEPKSIKYEKLEEMITRLHKTYFRFEYDKADRPSKDDDRRFIEKIISERGENIKKQNCVYGSCNEKITCDIVTDNKWIKIFDFDNKNLNLLVNNAKTWAWNAMQDNDNKIVIIYRYNEEISKYNKEFNIIMDIFKKAQTKIYNIEEGVNFL